VAWAGSDPVGHAHVAWLGGTTLGVDDTLLYLIKDLTDLT
jgi:hypothetical protein